MCQRATRTRFDSSQIRKIRKVASLFAQALRKIVHLRDAPLMVACHNIAHGETWRDCPQGAALGRKGGFSSNRKEIVARCFEKGEKVEKVDAAFGVVGGNDAYGFSGLGLAAWT